MTSHQQERLALMAFMAAATFYVGSTLGAPLLAGVLHVATALFTPTVPLTAEELWRAERPHTSDGIYGNEMGVICEVHIPAGQGTWGNAIVTPDLDTCEQKEAAHKFVWIVEPLKLGDAVVLSVLNSRDPRGPFYRAATWDLIGRASLPTS
jgi:hypothetical protein